MVLTAVGASGLTLVGVMATGVRRCDWT